MTAENLTATRSAETLAITSPAPPADLPTVVIALGPTLTAEINPGSKLPVRLATEDYPSDKKRIETLLGTETISLIDATGDGTYTLPFTPGPAWDTALDLAAQQWNLNWNPLPLAPELLALDLLRAQHDAITLTGKLPDQNLAKTAYPAAQTLQRLLTADAIAPEARPVVAKAITASHANTPLSYTDTTPYTIPVPFTPAEIHTILDDAPPTPAALATGSPDWQLTGHGPAATAENTINVLPHKTNPAAITIITPAKPHTDPENTPTYQALITDSVTNRTIATTTLRYTQATNTYTGHTTPRRPIVATDLVDIRDFHIPTPPISGLREREASRALRNAVRTFVQHAWQQPLEQYSEPSLAAAAARNRLLHSEVEGSNDLDFEFWFEFHASSDLLNVRSLGRRVGTHLVGRDENRNVKVEFVTSPGNPWLVIITSLKAIKPIEIAIRWASGHVTKLQPDQDPSNIYRISLKPPVHDDHPVAFASRKFRRD